MPVRKLRGMHISKRALRRHFDPCKYPHETYLLCQLHWGGRPWKHWVRNDEYHAEEYFLEEIFEPRSYGFCEMTWYLSWSPCKCCCDLIQDFMESQPNVSLDIHIARLYYTDRESIGRGLRDLHNLPRVTIRVMEAEDYEHCWETFIQEGVHYDFSPENFYSAIRGNRLKLKNILEDPNF